MAGRKFKNGEQVVLNKYVSSSYRSSYGLAPGMEVTVYDSAGSGYYYIQFINPSTGIASRVSIPLQWLDKYKAISKREQFQEQIEKAKEKIEATKAFIDETESKIKFMDELGVEEFDENEFKAYHTLLLIEKSDMTTIEKAKAIAKLISSK